MAGIGFELKKILSKKTFGSAIAAYLYAGLISSGPLLFSIIGVLFVCLLSLSTIVPQSLVAQFQVSVTYLFVGSIILTSILQLSFTRFVADRLFVKADNQVVPNFNVVLALIMGVSGVIGIFCTFFSFEEQSIVYKVLMASSFSILSGVWVSTIFLSGVKAYKAIVGLFFIAYSIFVLLAYTLRPFGLDGLLIGFWIGHTILLMGLLILIIRSYPSKRIISLYFFNNLKPYAKLMLIGFLLNVGVWADKLLFWFWPTTSSNAIGWLRVSVIYDLPISLAYITTVPGMAVFLMRIETDFVEYYNKFYDAVRDGDTLEKIHMMKNGMIFIIRQSIFEIMRIQSIAILIFFLFGEQILQTLKISTLYLPLFRIDTVSAGMQVVFLALLNVFFYIDDQRNVILLTGLFAVLNILFSTATLILGPLWYGYGFAVAILVCITIAFVLLNRTLEELEYKTFMLQ